MCVLFCAWKSHSRYRLIVASNRDEAHARQASAAHFWEDHPALIAGRDLEAGGTWLGVTRGGRFGALTNVRDLSSLRPDAPTRGMLVRAFLLSETSTEEYLSKLDTAPYNAFNLLLSDGETLGFLNSQEGRPRLLGPGVYGLSNGTLDEPWPKVVRGRAGFGALLEGEDDVDHEVLVRLMHDPSGAADSDLPDTGVGLERERMLAPLFISGSTYGTRATTVVTLSEAGGELTERTYGPNGEVWRTVHHVWKGDDVEAGQAASTA